MLSKRLFMYGVLAIGLATGLSACGGGDDGGNVASSNSTGSSGATGNGAGAAGSDAFLSQVMALIATSPDNTEPSATDSIAVTTPDNTEPVPII